MTHSQPHRRKPTVGQLDYLSDLALRVGRSFSYPATFEEASAEIKRLKQSRRLTPAERRRETLEARHEASERYGDAAAVRSDEVRGYGASASWR